MKAIFFLSLLVLIVLSCQPDERKDNDQDLNDTSAIEPSREGQLEKEMDPGNIYNQLGYFVSGKEATKFKNLQSKDFYINYSQKLDETWQQTTLPNLKSIENWVKENNLPLLDTLSVFYPFSGPDFLYANAFFPNAKTYILVGLENPGKLPNLAKMDDDQISIYLYKLYHSLRYINQNGYFTTSQMQSDFKDTSMNGIIHILMFYLAKSDYQINNINYIQVDDFGHEKEKKNFELESKLINGLKLHFYSEKSRESKVLYYFPFDLSDENMKDKLGFISFLSSFGLKNTFLKSASYLLHHPDFRLIQDLILKQSDKVLQDDSGLPYDELINSGFLVHLFGNYTYPTKTFEKYYQASLQKALTDSKSKELPFKLGYNSLKNEMVLMLARPGGSNINKPITYKTEKEGVVFKVQIKSSWKKIPLNSAVFKGLANVDYYYTDNLYKYTIGSFSSREACEEYIKIASVKGFKDAFVVAFYQKNRISLEEADRILKEK
jgi:hypothetical protein